ncbi:MAG: hypothetical protein KC589_01470 [Nanoarchaeota archaeon]|nr:hypothetical protein [Nanoarchaeota archaeon]
MITQLDIYIDEVLNPKLLIIKDTSWYNPDIVPSNGVIDVKNPIDNKIYSIPVGKDFLFTVNSNTLNITNVSDFKQLKELPDGIWTVKYSICPNQELFVEYSFLRNTKQTIKWMNLYCKLDLEKCNKKNYQEELKSLRDIKDLIDAAKYKADCGKYEQSLELYDRANQLLDSFSGKCKCLK